ncbi:hypothetical protein BGW36DRAFT_299318 [Talaromyces proteolyticus]|uniref:Rhodopsin domain-containing protein n=1 Tax=Talaromyces proteolyticus TaxID=1131652 RepID=A0AAD4PZA9_9EURO|nr:uncharacterized protein BGW36DRAFT_299318 [Talaromyces proteolyticus]KAH8695577.1 hypothetical protein BGW36DRAFT_299318 [Talaromyces proteolyticus]
MATGSQAIIIVTAVFLALSLVTVSLRCFVRLRVVKSFGRDDALMVAAAISNIACAAFGIFGAVHGMGKSSGYLLLHPDDVRLGLLGWWLGQCFYIITCTLARMSIAITLLRIAVEPIHQRILYSVIMLSTIVGIVFFFFTIFQCSPVHYYWDRTTMLNGHCLNINALLGIVYMYSGVAAVCDFTMGILPGFMIRKLQMNRRTKIAVSGILGIACVASTAVIVRIPFLHDANSPNFLYTTTDISIWSNIEASLGITAGSLAVTRPFFRIFASHAGSSQTNEDSYIMLSGNRPNVVLGRYNTPLQHPPSSRSEGSLCGDCQKSIETRRSYD